MGNWYISTYVASELRSAATIGSELRYAATSFLRCILFFITQIEIVRRVSTTRSWRLDNLGHCCAQSTRCNAKSCSCDSPCTHLHTSPTHCPNLSRPTTRGAVAISCGPLDVFQCRLQILPLGLERDACLLTDVSCFPSRLRCSLNSIDEIVGLADLA